MRGLAIDLNCDLGEGAGRDNELMPLITSANIACGGHAGDFAIMRATVELAAPHGVAVGAHPSFLDRDHFGRRELDLPADEIRKHVCDQILALRAIGSVRHVKPHGALYNLAARDRGVAQAIVDAIQSVDTKLILYGLSGSELIRVGRERGLKVANEVFADRTYQSDGTLTPRSRPDALVPNLKSAVEQVLHMLEEGVVVATDGSRVPIVADTLCLHGDGPHAVEFAQGITQALRNAGVSIRAFP